MRTSRLFVAAVAAAATLATPALAGTFGPPELVDSPASASCPGPDVGADAQGGATIVYNGAGGLKAATRPPGGSWTVEPLGSGTRGKLDVSADGDALYAWRSGTTVRTAYRTAGGGWTIPEPGSPGTFAATSVLAVAAGLDSDGKGVVAWLDEISADSFVLRYSLRDATGTWSQPADAAVPGGVRGFGNGHAFLDDTGAIVLAFQDATAPPNARGVMRLARRDPGGAWSSADLTPSSANLYASGGCNHAFDAELDPITRRLVVAYGVNTSGSGAAPDRYQVWEGAADLQGAIKVDVPSSNTPPYHAVSLRPGGVSGGAVAAFKLDPQGDNQDIHGFAAPQWTTFTTQTSVNSAVTSMGVARTTGLDLAAIWTFIDAEAPQSEVYKVRGMARDHEGNWGTPVTITTGSNYGGVNMAPDGAGGAIGTWVDTSGKLWSVDYFGGPPVPDGGPSDDGEPAAPGGDPPPGAFDPARTIIGTPGPDVLTGTPQDDLIIGLGGDDRIDGGGGNDTLLGNSGKDVITGGDGRDKLLGGDGDDHLLTADGGQQDEAQAGTGLDRIEVEVPIGAETAPRARQLGISRVLKKVTMTLDWGVFTKLTGTAEALKPLCDLASRLCGAAGTTLGSDLGGLGTSLQSSMRDFLGRQGQAELPPLLTPAMAAAAATLGRADGGTLGRIAARLGFPMSARERSELRGALDRTLGALGGLSDVFGDFADRLPEISGVMRTMTGGAPDPGVIRIDSDGRLSGTARDDLLVGSGRGDRIEGGGGDDVILPVGGNDRVDAGAGNDLVLGSGGGDRLAGGRGDDHITAGGGDDRIDLGAGNDTAAVAGAGRDRFDMGSGHDVVGTGRQSRSGLFGSVSRVIGKSGLISGMIGPGLGRICRDAIAGVCEGMNRIGSGLGALGDLATGTAAEVRRVPADRGSGGLLGGVGRMVTRLGIRLPDLGSLRSVLVPIVPQASLSAAQAAALAGALGTVEREAPRIYDRIEDALGADQEIA